MPGPYLLRYVHLFVSKRSPGAFILSRNGRSADYVGMSEDDLPRSLGRFRRHSQYRYFWFHYAESIHEASRVAGHWYHRYRPSDNPAAPEGLKEADWRCTEHSCTTCALERSGALRI